MGSWIFKSHVYRRHSVSQGKEGQQPASRKMMEAANDVCKAEEEEGNNQEGDMSNDEGIGGCDVEEITEDEERKVKMKRKPSWFGRVLMFFVTNKQQKMARRQKSLISRNRRGTGFNASMKRIRQRTMSMVSLVSTNFAESSRSRANSQSRSRHTSAVDRAVESLKGRERHTSMVDRIEAWGEEYDQPPASGYTEGDPTGRTRKVSKVDFEAPSERQGSQRIRKTSKVEFSTPQKTMMLEVPGEKSGSLIRSKIAAGRTLPDYS